MPTRVSDCFAAIYEERGDLDFTREEIGVNSLGLPSHATKSYRGQLFYSGVAWFPYANLGFRRQSGVPMTRATFWAPEGCHETNAGFYFKDLSIPQGATISAASISLYAGEGGTVFDDAGSMSGDFHYFPTGDTAARVKIYGIAEDNAQGRGIEVASGYNMTYGAEYYPPTGNPRRHRVNSYTYEKAHTAVKVQWALTGSAGVKTTPDISSVIQEIVDRPDWKPNNRLCLIFGNDGMYANYYTPETFPPDPTATGWDTYISYDIRWGAPHEDPPRKPVITVTF